MHTTCFPVLNDTCVMFHNSPYLRTFSGFVCHTHTTTRAHTVINRLRAQQSVIAHGKGRERGVWLPWTQVHAGIYHVYNPCCANMETCVCRCVSVCVGLPWVGYE